MGFDSWYVRLYRDLLELLGSPAKLELVWIASENKLVVHTDRVEGTILAEVTDMLEQFVPSNVEIVWYNHNMEVNWRDLNKYAECKTLGNILAVNANYKQDLTSEGEWVYPLNALTSGSRVFTSSSMKKAVIYMPNVTYMRDSMNECRRMETLDIYAPKATDCSYMCNNCPSLRKVTGDLRSMSNGYEAFKNTAVEIFECELPSLSNGYRLLTSAISTDVGARLNKESALRVLNSIPAYTSGSHLLYIGIHIDHKYDPEVNLALKKVDINYTPTVELSEEVTTGKGWTLTVQWNGTPTSTASMMSFGQPIYAKVGEHELPDGTTEQFLDWGHYVTNWEERGYEQFRSIYAAYEYFGLPNPDTQQ